ncbi:MAG TPA: alpha/beta fold hydrolase [Nocardioides sp.]|uniref:alpha/beta fold hydrolase n=1 Tax=Nocardioides sp. TaxID=35761 RepID=UPI002BBBF67A|nr:alpha/beta fold hydrolase [Nocardioides sp.]HQR25763.1 alpha/beta fold hydrolase [Nocardioides sp.]
MAADPVHPPQDLRFCRSADGTTIAYAVHGTGPPLVLDACWLSHLQFDWQSPVWRHYLVELGKVATVIRFDERGHGLSDREVADFGLEARIADLEAVVDDAGLGRFALMAMAQGGPVSIEYAVRHPARLTRLLFYGSYSGALHHASPEEVELDDAFEAIIRVGWERPTPEFRRVFTYQMIPGATEEQMAWLDELQRIAVTARTAHLARRERKRADATHLLGELRLPTLVLHSREDHMNGFEEARALAAGISGARLVALESANHIVLEDEPAWPVFLREVTEFLAPDRAQVGRRPAATPITDLSPRELEVLELAAEGLDNAGIADSLTLSVRTVERHFQNIYAKLDVQGKSARTAAVARLLAGR